MRFHGKVGFGTTVETSPGVHEDVIVEQIFYGDVVRNSRTLAEGENLNKDLSVSHSISIVAANSVDVFNIRYVEWAGTLWSVPNVEIQGPRLLLTLGEVYNGPTPEPAPDSP